MLKKLALLAALLAAASGVARADQPVVVELYTSQGCSSCPPADALMAQMAERDDIIALALHVDYWDYIGWKDDFARPAHADRQRAYAREKGKTMIYTPQMVVQGQTHLAGNKSMDIADAIAAHRRGEAPVAVSLERRGGIVEVTARRAGAVPGDMVIDLVTYMPKATRDIRRGENAGRTLAYHNIVTDWRTLANWDGSAPFRARVRLDGDTPVAVLVQTAGPGPVLGAARLR